MSTRQKIMRKSVTKRIKFTKTGKLLHRKSGHNHFNAKASRKLQHRRNALTAVVKPFDKKLRAFANL